MWVFKEHSLIETKTPAGTHPQEGFCARVESFVVIICASVSCQLLPDTRVGADRLPVAK